MRTVEIRRGEKKRSMFEIYSLVILGRVPKIEQSKASDLVSLFKKASKSKSYQLSIKPSKCGQFTDILKIKRAQREPILSVNN